MSLKDLSPVEMITDNFVQTPMLRDVWHALAQRPQGIEQAPEDYGYLTARFVELFGEV
jgi:hypothetical protein